MYVKYAKILQMSIRCLCRQMNAYNGSKKKIQAIERNFASIHVLSYSGARI